MLAFGDKCPNCGNTLQEVEAAGEDVMDFAVRNKGQSKTGSFSLSIGKWEKRSAGILHSENGTACYCDKCKKVFAEFDII